MKQTTLCYIENDGKYLMLYRNRKKDDENKGKWIGVGGKLENGESPVECMIREVREETGLLVKSFEQRGVITFVSDVFGCEYMYLYTISEFEGKLIECSEGRLEWIDKSKVMDLPTWEGDRIFLSLLLKDMPYFDLKLVYEGERLVRAYLNAQPLAI